MKLELNKTYRAKSGKLFFIYYLAKDGLYHGECVEHVGSTTYFYPDGRRWFRPEKEDDLVEEVTLYKEVVRAEANAGHLAMCKIASKWN